MVRYVVLLRDLLVRKIIKCVHFMSKTTSKQQIRDGVERQPIILYNTLTRSKEKFVPILPGQVSLYVCGPTVYNYAHIGNLRTYILNDVLRRVLEYNGLKVKQVMNVTDVGHLVSDADEGMDKMERGAQREGKNIWEIAKKYTDAFFNDCDRLNIIRPTIVCRATDHITEQIALIEVLEKKGYTYRTSDGVYFDSSKFEDYGRLGHLDKEGIRAGIRVRVGGKKHPTDFALWKFSPKDEKRQMEWDSPWGKGFPGWHIECSAMAMKYLGPHIDIHTGGTDHIPIHHTNEIAQSEAATGERFVNFWLHGAFLVSELDKMSKSTGDFLTLETIIARGFDPLEYRYFCLRTHYRKQLNFSMELLADARDMLMGLKKDVIRLREAVGEEKPQRSSGAYDSEFLEYINNDLDLNGSFTLVHKLLRDNTVNPSEKYASLLKFDSIFGLDIASWRSIEKKVPTEIMELAEEREKARKNGDWKSADEIRAKIASKGFAIEDSKEGYKIVPRS